MCVEVEAQMRNFYITHAVQTNRCRTVLCPFSNWCQTINRATTHESLHIAESGERKFVNVVIFEPSSTLHMSISSTVSAMKHSLGVSHYYHCVIVCLSC
jgi:hypothetical protein